MYLDGGAADGLVQICPDMSEYALPGLRYHFYNTDGETEWFYLESDEDGNFTGKLPAGTYRVIATNFGADGVVFSGMDHYETAGVSAINTSWARGETPVNYLTQPDPVFSVVLRELVATGAGTVRYVPVPVLLTKQLTLVFALQGELQTEVAGMSGILRGVYPYVQLYTCTTPPDRVEEGYNRAVKFSTEADGDQHRAQISLFGLCDPEYGDAYSNFLTLDLTMTDGTTATGTLDLTETLSDIIQENQGTIPVEVSLEVAVEKVGTQLTAVVERWREGGSGSGDF